MFYSVNSEKLKVKGKNAFNHQQKIYVTETSSSNNVDYIITNNDQQTTNNVNREMLKVKRKIAYTIFYE